ncbi:hypothetical protein BKA67DRAFT_659622 [Truncatella angustata]|uniref:Thioredoxin-like protein AAED1 n=1 Tax=Truncatella angustata TaxID=152316 RepID=A0A9P8UJ30_9PEZI|nr:uncharacterized protein BKA67DRAFT_659622 [Truncatella angustata]KAH6652970.1 hypothetical protein BKA67DRAFT_659622 [Truncatella angustata]KAH8195319.1 hypothetical protein TruAng_010512 [Truncatella angustata]
MASSDAPAATAAPTEAPKAYTETAQAHEGADTTKLDATTRNEPFDTAAISASPVDTTIGSGTSLGLTGPPADAIPNQDDTNPLDFQGDVQTNNNLPSQETLRKLEKYTVLDESGKSHTFKSLYTGPNVARRVLIIFIRHFFCGNCQEYLRHLSAAIPPESLLQLPVSTSIAVIGCGSHKLIQAYLQQTGCPYPVYADNTQHLYKELGMIRTLAAGDRPAYMQHKSMAQTVFSGIAQALKQVKSGLVLQMGDQKQVGGEFLFEPASLSVESPIATPHELSAGAADRDPLGDLDDRAADKRGEEKKVTWCHRMRNTRDHVEIPELVDVLGLEGPEDQAGGASSSSAPAAASQRAGSTKSGKAGRHEERWAKATRERKGTGLSMASQMSRMSMDAKGYGQAPPPPPEAVKPLRLSQEENL